MLTLNNLIKLPSKKKQRVGRGEGSHRGKNAGKGHKGQKKRNPSSIRVDFEGGQARLTKRSPKFKGFKSKRNIYTQEVPVSALNVLEKDSVVNLALLKEVGLIKQSTKKVRIILKGGLDVKISIQDDNIYLTKGVKSLLA
jgi:large subunit ribosomal protein L15